MTSGGGIALAIDVKIMRGNKWENIMQSMMEGKRNFGLVGGNHFQQRGGNGKKEEIKEEKKEERYKVFLNVQLQKRELEE